MKRVGRIILKTVRSNTFVDILKDIAQVFFAAMFVESLMGKQIHITTMIIGLFISATFWLISLLIASNLNLNKLY